MDNQAQSMLALKDIPSNTFVTPVDNILYLLEHDLIKVPEFHRKINHPYDPSKFDSKLFSLITIADCNDGNLYLIDGYRRLKSLRMGNSDANVMVRMLDNINKYDIPHYINIIHDIEPMPESGSRYSDNAVVVEHLNRYVNSELLDNVGDNSPRYHREDSVITAATIIAAAQGADPKLFTLQDVIDSIVPSAINQTTISKADSIFYRLNSVNRQLEPNIVYRFVKPIFISTIAWSMAFESYSDAHYIALLNFLLTSRILSPCVRRATTNAANDWQRMKDLVSLSLEFEVWNFRKNENQCYNDVLRGKFFFEFNKNDIRYIPTLAMDKIELAILCASQSTDKARMVAKRLYNNFVDKGNVI